MVEQGDYGPVKVTDGPLKGLTGYYDDDEEEGWGIVYLGVPFASPWKRVKLEAMELAEEPTEGMEMLERDAPDVLARLGAVIRRD